MRCPIILILLFISHWASAQFDTERAYLEQNFEVLNPDSVTGLFKFDEPKEKYRFYLVGEKHDHKGNKEIELAVLKHLMVNNGVKFYLLENSFSGEYLIKKFLELPDTNLENNPYIPLLYRNKKKDFDEYYRPLYDMYHSLPEAEKLKIKAIDLEMNLGQVYRAMAFILEQHTSIDTIYKMALDLTDKGGKARGKRKQYNVAEKLDTLFKENKEVFKNFLKDDFEDFKTMMRGLKKGKNWLMTLDTNNYQQASEIRETYMLDNIKELMQEHPKARFFAQLGITHVVDFKEEWIDKVTDWKSLAWRLENEMGQAVCKACIFYPKTYSKKVKYCAIQEEYESLFLEFATDKIALFNLNKPDSPFRVDGKPIKREYCKTFDGKDYPMDISLEFNYVILNNYFQF